MSEIKLFLIMVLIIPFVACGAQTDKKNQTTASSDKVEAYYFHFTNRCVTCKTVEAETKADLQSLYGDKVKFQAINLDDESSKALANRLQVSGQTLILVKGNTKINITNEGFMYARTNPEKLKSVIKEKVDGLLKS
jgi:hypothetical protein